MATHSSVLAWKIPGMGKPGGLPSMGSRRVGHNWSDLAAAAAAATATWGHKACYHNSHTSALLCFWFDCPQTAFSKHISTMVCKLVFWKSIWYQKFSCSLDMGSYWYRLKKLPVLSARDQISGWQSLIPNAMSTNIQVKASMSALNSWKHNTDQCWEMFVLFLKPSALNTTVIWLSKVPADLIWTCLFLIGSLPEDWGMSPCSLEPRG